MSDEIQEVFLQEFDDFFSIIKEQLQNAKSNKPTNNYEIFRAFHTWKGNGALLGFDDFVSFSDKYCEHFRPFKDGNSLSSEISVLETIVSDLDAFRKGFQF